MMKSPFIAVALLAAAAWLGPTTASAADSDKTTPLISGYGRIVAVEKAGERPDPMMDYKVVIAGSKNGELDAPAPALEKAARLANLLAASGVPADHRHIVVILNGAATPAVLNEAGEKARGKGANASAELIAKLTTAGVSVHVCGQALVGSRISQSEVIPGIQVDLSALTTISTLELKGYAVLTD